MKRFTGFAQMLASCAEDYGELPALMGADGALRTITYAQLHAQALSALTLFGEGAGFFRDLVDSMVDRTI